jgi:hypothetical protein
MTSAAIWRWSGVSAAVAAQVLARDGSTCVYCRKTMDPKSSNRADHPSVEHLNHLPTFQHDYPKTAAYFAICCFGCNASRRDRPLSVWLRLKGYAETCAQVVKDYALRPQASWAIDPAAVARDRAAVAACALAGVKNAGGRLSEYRHLWEA